tara:strand:- start:390 stop:656 length:267 start_codon:yes stop_codon:yes gene_type:complete
MATNDFARDLLDRLEEEGIEYLLVTVQKGKEEHHAEAYFNMHTVDGVDVIATTVDEVFKQLIEDGKDPDDDSDSPDVGEVWPDNPDKD